MRAYNNRDNGIMDAVISFTVGLIGTCYSLCRSALSLALCLTIYWSLRKDKRHRYHPSSVAYKYRK